MRDAGLSDPRSRTLPDAASPRPFAGGIVGVDLHKRYITACALNPAGEVIAEMRQLSTSLEAVLAWLGALPGPVTNGLEATLYWEWLAARLREQAHTVRVAHVFHVKLI